MTNVIHGGWKTNDWTLPLALTVPNYYATDGKTPLAPTRVTMTAAEWEDAKYAAASRGKLPPPNWKVLYGAATASTRIVVYQRQGDRILRQEGYGTVTRPTATSISWTWASTTAPLSVEVARGVIQIQGVHQVVEDLTPEDLTELPPDDINTAFKANYSIRYLPSAFTKAAPQPTSIINNNLLLRMQFYGL
jgi:hypothetical protein